DNEDSGLQFYPGGDNNLATLNVSYDNGDHGIDDLNVTGGRLIGNTIYHNCTSGINVEGTSGNYLVENNISVDNAVFLVNPPAIDSADSGASGAQATDVTGAARTDDPTVANTGIGPRAYDDRGAYEFGGGGGPLPPTAALTVSPSSGTAPLPVTADASGSTDPQGQPLTYTFTFGDGTTVGPQSSATASHTYAAAGSYPVSVTVTDTANLSGSTQQSVTVSAGGGGGGNPAYVSQIATNYSTGTHTSGYVAVWRTQGVVAGDLAVLSVQL